MMLIFNKNVMLWDYSWPANDRFFFIAPLVKALKQKIVVDVKD